MLSQQFLDVSGTNPVNTFNEYVLEWDPDKVNGYIRISVGGTKLLNVAASSFKGRCDPSRNCVGDRTFINEPQYFILNMAI